MCVSRDLLIKEDESWDWKTGEVKLKVVTKIDICSDSDGDDHSDTEVNEGAVHGAVAPNDAGTSVVAHAVPTAPKTRSQRPRQLLRRLEDCEVLPNSAVTEEGNVIHFGLLADAEPINFTETTKIKVESNTGG